MNRFSAGAVVALFASSTALLAAPVLHASAHLSAAPAQYYSSVIYPQGTSIAHGSMATLPDINGLKVKFYVGYLKPGEIYNEDVRTGACLSGGRSVITLGLNQTDGDGSLNLVTTINPSVLAQSSTLHVDVSSAMPGSPVVACGNILKANIILHLHSVKTNVVANAGGIAYFTFGIRGNEVLYRTPNATGTSVVVFGQGLEPGTTHEVHIHDAQCIPDQAKQVRYDLYYMETDANGEGVSGTFFDGHINLGNSYVQIHGANLQAVACANLGSNALPRS